MLVLETISSHAIPDQPHLSATSGVRLFADAKGNATVQVHLEPGPACPLRPVWRVAEVTSTAEVSTVLDASAAAFEVPAPPGLSDQIKRMSDQVRASHSQVCARI